MREPLLVVEDLCVTYANGFRAVDGVSFSVGPGEVFGLAGESGSGKSTVAHALLRVLPAGARLAGRIHCAGHDVLALDAPALRRFRWRRASLVLQAALDALSPVLTIGTQLADVLIAHERLAPREARRRAAALLELVDIPAQRLDHYPHQLSGGMRQRVVIAMALALDPPLVILDEPTTALDVITQAALFDDLAALRARLGFAVLLVTHDLPLMLSEADRVAIMAAGKLVEVAPSADLLAAPAHPQTRALLAAIPPRLVPPAPLPEVHAP